MRFGKWFSGVAVSVALAACASIPTGPSVAVMPAPGKPFEEFRADDAVCREFARQQLGVNPSEVAQQPEDFVRIAHARAGGDLRVHDCRGALSGAAPAQAECRRGHARGLGIVLRKDWIATGSRRITTHGATGVWNNPWQGDIQKHCSSLLFGDVNGRS